MSKLFFKFFVVSLFFYTEVKGLGALCSNSFPGKGERAEEVAKLSSLSKGWFIGQTNPGFSPAFQHFAMPNISLLSSLRNDKT